MDIHGMYRDLYTYHGYPWYRCIYIEREISIYTMDIHGIYRDLYIYIYIYIYTMNIHGIYRDLYIYHEKPKSIITRLRIVRFQ